MNAGRAFSATRLWGLAVLILTAASGVAATEPTGSCYHARTYDAVVLPDGSVRGPGRIELCLDRRATPVSEVHEITVGTRPYGRFTGRWSRLEGPLDRPYIRFRPNENGELILVEILRQGRRPGAPGERIRFLGTRELQSLVDAGMHDRPATEDTRAWFDAFAASSDDDVIVNVAAAP